MDVLFIYYSPPHPPGRRLDTLHVFCKVRPWINKNNQKCPPYIYWAYIRGSFFGRFLVHFWTRAALCKIHVVCPISGPVGAILVAVTLKLRVSLMNIKYIDLLSVPPWFWTFFGLISDWHETGVSVWNESHPFFFHPNPAIQKYPFF